MNERTYLVVAQYRHRSPYDDELGERYHFPRKYYSQLNLPNIQFVYFEPEKRGEGVYFGCGEIGDISPDPKNPDHFFATILNYRPFAKLVSRLDELGLPRESGPFFNPQNAVRKTTSEVFASICAFGGIE